MQIERKDRGLLVGNTDHSTVQTPTLLNVKVLKIRWLELVLKICLDLKSYLLNMEWIWVSNYSKQLFIFTKIKIL